MNPKSYTLRLEAGWSCLSVAALGRVPCSWASSLTRVRPKPRKTLGLRSSLNTRKHT